MQSVFNITSIEGDYSNKRIIIQTNFTVDKDTVIKKNVQVVDALSGTTVIYKLLLDDDKIIVLLKDSPSTESFYQVNVKEIKDMLGRDLADPLTKNIQFKVDVQSKAIILLPENSSAVIREHNLVYYSIKRINKEGKPVLNPNPELVSKTETPLSNKEAILEDESDVTHHFEFASDTAFFNVVKSTSSPYTDGLIDLEPGQYYMRARVECNNLKGDWSETVTFTVVPDRNQCDDLTESQKKYLDEVFSPVDFFLDDEEELTILSYSENGISASEFYIEFNKDIDFEKIQKNIVVYRRGL